MHKNKGKKFTEEHKKKLSEAHKGKKMSKEARESMSKGKMGKPCKNGFKKGLVPWNKGMKFEQVSGEKCHLWRGGITKINTKIRNSMEYRLWRESVFERDNWTCIWCNKKGGKLHADHIKPFSLYPELRLAIDNGRTLCVECHKKTDTYLKRIDIKKQ